MTVPRRVPLWSRIVCIIGSRPPDADPALMVARRLSLASNANDQQERPWRYWALHYLANVKVGRPEHAIVALEMLRDECTVMLNELRKGRTK